MEKYLEKQSGSEEFSKMLAGNMFKNPEVYRPANKC